MVGLPAGSGPEAFFSYAVKGSRACLPSSQLFFYQGALFKLLEPSFWKAQTAG